MRRLQLEARRLRGWIAWCIICRTPISLDLVPRFLLGWAGLFAHWDADRTNWRNDQ